jgi:ribosome recycling factor
MIFIDEAKPHFEKAKEHLTRELGMIRTGRATPALVEDLQVESYGVYQPLKAIASINTPDARTIQIQPWDRNAVKSIESAIMKSDIGINPNVDGLTIRLSMPMMTDEMRQRMVKLVKEKLEEARIAVRKVREEVKKKIDKQEGVSEDIRKSDLESLETKVKAVIAEIEEMGRKKETEITTI